MYQYIDFPLNGKLAFVEAQKERSELDWEAFRRFASLVKHNLFSGLLEIDIVDFAKKYGPLFQTHKGDLALAEGILCSRTNLTAFPAGSKVIIEESDRWQYHINCFKDLLLLHFASTQKFTHPELVLLRVIQDNMIVYTDELGQAYGIFHGTSGDKDRRREKDDAISDQYWTWLETYDVPFYFKTAFFGEDTTENRLKWLRDNKVLRLYANDYFANNIFPADTLIFWLQRVLRDVLDQNKCIEFCNVCGEVLTQSDGSTTSLNSHSCRLAYYRNQEELDELIVKNTGFNEDCVRDFMGQGKRRFHYIYDNNAWKF